MASVSGGQSPAVSSTQKNWRWCSKCQCLFFAGTAVCGNGGVHDHSTSGDYSLMQSGGQTDWKWCKKCQVLSYINQVIGPCAAGGVHDISESANYSLPFSGGSVRGQADWKWCNKCQGLALPEMRRPGIVWPEVSTTIRAAVTTAYLSMEILLVDRISGAGAPSARCWHSMAIQPAPLVVPT
jgi:hypothetical protein